MDTEGANYEFISYEGAYMVFLTLLLMNVVKNLTFQLAYNENADIKSWKAMKKLFEQFLWVY